MTQTPIRPAGPHDRPRLGTALSRLAVGFLTLAAGAGCWGPGAAEGQVFEVLSDGRRALRYELDLGGPRLTASDLDGRWLALELGQGSLASLQGLEPRWRDGTKPLWKLRVSEPPGSVEQRFEVRPGVVLVRRLERLSAPGALPAAVRVSGAALGRAERAVLAADRERLVSGFSVELDPTQAWLLEIPASELESDGRGIPVIGGEFDFSAPRSPLGLLPAAGEPQRLLRYRFAPCPAGRTDLRARLSGAGRVLELWSDASELEIGLSGDQPPRLSFTPLPAARAADDAAAAASESIPVLDPTSEASETPAAATSVWLLR
jgi:hypothetical protein